MAFLETQPKRLMKESKLFLTDEEKTDVERDTNQFLLQGSAYNRLFLNPQMLALIGLCSSVTVYQKIGMLTRRPVSFASQLARTLSLSYLVGFCIFTDSKAFYSHLYAMTIEQEKEDH